MTHLTWLKVELGERVGGSPTHGVCVEEKLHNIPLLPHFFNANHPTSVPLRYGKTSKSQQNGCSSGPLQCFSPPNSSLISSAQCKRPHTNMMPVIENNDTEIAPLNASRPGWTEYRFGTTPFLPDWPETRAYSPQILQISLQLLKTSQQLQMQLLISHMLCKWKNCMLLNVCWRRELCGWNLAHELLIWNLEDCLKSSNWIWIWFRLYLLC